MELEIRIKDKINSIVQKFVDEFNEKGNGEYTTSCLIIVNGIRHNMPVVVYIDNEYEDNSILHSITFGYPLMIESKDTRIARISKPGGHWKYYASMLVGDGKFQAYWNSTLEENFYNLLEKWVSFKIKKIENSLAQVMKRLADSKIKS